MFFFSLKKKLKGKKRRQEKWVAVAAMAKRGGLYLAKEGVGMGLTRAF
jgi:hypothetical protein